MAEHAVLIAGAGPTGLMLAGELALVGIDVAVVERRASQELVGSRAGGLHSRTIEVLDQSGDPTGMSPGWASVRECPLRTRGLVLPGADEFSVVFESLPRTDP